MSKLRSLRGPALVAALIVIALGIAYAVEIRRDLAASVFIGKVQTVDETVLLYREAPPSTADLEELSFGADIDAIGFFSSAPKVPFWAATPTLSSSTPAFASHSRWTTST